MVKASGGQRESDGVVVPVIGVEHDAPGEKGPDFDHACGEGKGQGMTGTARSNKPGRSWPVDLEGPSLRKVRELQCKLWAAAKQSEGRRFHALFDRVHRGDVLWEAWERVGKNRGAAGVDRVTLVAVEGYGVDRMLRELRDDLRAGVYRPAPARRVDISKPDGGKRPLGIPTVRDRVAQQAAKFVQVDDHVVWRLRRLMIKKRGRNLRAGQARQWNEDWFNGHGLHRLRGTIRYPKTA
jgi:RNA-directed DNA polymerase